MTTREAYQEMLRDEQEIVYVMVYHHRHGEDVEVHGEERTAVAAITECILGEMDELSEATQESILSLVEEGRTEEAQTLYEKHCDEWFEVLKLPVLP